MLVLVVQVIHIHNWYNSKKDNLYQIVVMYDTILALEEAFFQNKKPMEA